MTSETKPKTHTISYDPHARYGGITAVCTCSWTFFHRRPPVVEKAARRHLTKKGVL